MIALMMILDRYPPTQIGVYHHQPLRGLRINDRLAAHDLCPFVYPCVAIAYGHFSPSHVHWLTTFVMRHSYGLKVQFR